eukprot:jgi/Galph1/2878/GphlegSOOS_G1523.1
MATDNIHKFVFPGEILVVLKEGENIRIGQGIVRKGNRLVAVKPGYVRQQANSKIWVETSQRRYIPCIGDTVIGVIMDRSSDYYVVDIGTNVSALLPVLSFEGATKRNRPHLTTGSIVYARVVSADREKEPQLSCLLPGSQHSWVTGETIFGELSEGFLIHCSINLVRNILIGRNKVFRKLGEYVPFEQATGMNGRIWIRSKSPAHVVLLVNVIQCSENMTNEQLSYLINNLVSKTS